MRHTRTTMEQGSRGLAPAIKAGGGTALVCLCRVGACLLLVMAAWTAWAVDKSGVSPTAISLPSGPGSIQGLGESFEPMLNTGGANYGIGMVVPDGPVGHTPSLQLSYSSGDGNGILGFGWDMPVPYIQRRTDYGIPRYVDEANGIDDDGDGLKDEADELDEFINDDGELLVPQDNGDYFPQYQSLSVRYRRVGDHWEATDSEGTVLQFGLTASARIQDDEGRVFKWLLEKEIDTSDNTIEYRYTSNPTISDPHVSDPDISFAPANNLNQKYLDEIRYGSGPPPWDAFHFVRFKYRPRTDWFEECRAGFIIRTGVRLSEVVVGTQGVDLPNHAKGHFSSDLREDCLNRRYVLRYKSETHWSLLNEVQLIGADDTTTFPSTRFTYAEAKEAGDFSAAGVTIGSLNEPTRVPDNPLVEFLDINGDALPDLLETAQSGGAHVAYLNQGETVIDGERVIRWSDGVEIASEDGLAWNFNLESESRVVHLADMNGDGRADLVCKPNDYDVHYFQNMGNMRWGGRQPMSVQGHVPPAPFANPNVRTADLDCDRRIDVIESIFVGDRSDYRIWFNLGDQTYSKRYYVGQDHGVSFAKSGVEIADLNGDGVSDVARIRPFTVEVTPGLGYGRFGAVVTMEIPTVTLTDDQVARTFLTDITGDGLDDLVLERAETTALWYWINLGNYTFSERGRITNLPATIGINAETRWADLNGNGTDDLIFADAQSVPKLQTVDLGELLGCVPAAHLMTSIDNGIGGLTTIKYATSTRFYLEDWEKAGWGDTPWPDPLPFPVEVVAQVVRSTSTGSPLVSDSKYHKAWYDAERKQFAGFAEAEQIERGDADTPTLVMHFEYHVGRDCRARKGKPKAQTARREDETRFYRNETTWTCKDVRTNHEGQTVTYAYPEMEVQRVYELSDEPLTLLSKSAFDEYGNQTLAADYGIVGDIDDEASWSNWDGWDDERITETQYVHNLDRWLVSFPKRIEVRDENGLVASRSDFFYDDDSFSGNNYGIIEWGALSMTRDWVNPNDDNSFIESTRIRYDAVANPEYIFDAMADLSSDLPDSHYRKIRYDPLFQTHAVEETIYVGGDVASLTAHADYDEGLGTIQSYHNLNNHRTTYGYDALGRLTSVRRPNDDAPDYPTTEYEYVLAKPSGDSGSINYVETRNLDKAPGTPGTIRDHYYISRQYIDGLGRFLLQKSEAERDPEHPALPRVVVEEAVTFNARSLAAMQLQPFYSLAGNSLDELLAFEDIAALDWQGGKFHEEGMLITRTLEDAHKTKLTYDAQLRLIKSTNVDDTFSEIIHQPLSTKRYDENDTDKASLHYATPVILRSDGLGRLAKIEEIVHDSVSTTTTWLTQYGYDASDNLVRIEDAQANVTLMEYDGLDRRTYLNHPDSGEVRYFFDAASSLDRTTDAKGQVIKYTYDGVNRLITEDYLDDDEPFSVHRTPDVTYTYDVLDAQIPLGNGETDQPNNTLGFLVRVEDLSGAEYTSYNERGLPEWVVKEIVEPRTQNRIAYQTAMAYDSMDRVVELTYPDGDRVEMKYNDRSRVSRIAGGAGVNLPGNDFLLQGVLHTPSGQLEAVTFGNGVEDRRRYDHRQRLTTLQASLPQQPANPLLRYAYKYDTALNIVDIDDQRAVERVPAGSARRNSQSFTYDDTYRLAHVQYDFSAPEAKTLASGRIDYRYDAISNMIAKTSDLVHDIDGVSVTNPGTFLYEGGASGRVGRTTPAPGPHAMTGTADGRKMTYDGNGNMSALDGMAMTWDFKDRLIAVKTPKKRAEYVYDYRDHRTVKKVWQLDASGDILPDSLVATQYVDQYYEVRQHKQPVKYVWIGKTRVARATGRFDADAPHVQRFSLSAGWNMLSLAVDAPDAAAQLGLGNDARILASFLWNDDAHGYDILSASDPLPPGSVLWLQTAENMVTQVQGAFVEAPERTLKAGQSMAPLDGTMALYTEPLLAAGVKKAAYFDAVSQKWREWQEGEPAFTHTLPDFLPPGAGLFVTSSEPVTMALPASERGIQYYHQDHLKSSNLLTDAHGAILEETAFYPFGGIRNEHKPGDALVALPSNYGYAQKELDRESGLLNFEARHMAGHLARFVRVDPAVQDGPENFIHDPQLLNPYAYSRNNPILFGDSTGRSPEGALSLIGADGGGSTMSSAFSSDRQLIDTGGWSAGSRSGAGPIVKGGSEGTSGGRTETSTEAYLADAAAGADPGGGYEGIDSAYEASDFEGGVEFDISVAKPEGLQKMVNDLAESVKARLKNDKGTGTEAKFLASPENKFRELKGRSGHDRYVRSRAQYVRDRAEKGQKERSHFKVEAKEALFTQFRKDRAERAALQGGDDSGNDPSDDDRAGD